MSTTSFVTHFRELSAAAKNLGLHAQIQFDSLRVEVAGSDRYFELEPEFAIMDPRGFREFSHELPLQSRAFTGWRCGSKKTCEVSLDKNAFLAFCARNQVRTPRIYARASDVTSAVVVKQVRPGKRGIIRGPFARDAIPAECLQPPNEVILQEFVPGQVLEAWYWNGQLFVVQILNRPSVVGDGVSPIRDLIACNSLHPDWIDWAAAEDALRFQGETIDTVLPSGKELAVDIRFNTAVQMPAFGPENALNTIVGTPVHEQLLHAGPVFFNALPADIRPHTQFVLGAIIDSQQRLWFTDMVTDLRIHPDVYDLMLRGLFGIPAPCAPPAGSQANTAADPVPAS